MFKYLMNQRINLLRFNVTQFDIHTLQYFNLISNFWSYFNCFKIGQSIKVNSQKLLRESVVAKLQTGKLFLKCDFNPKSYQKWHLKKLNWILIYVFQIVESIVYLKRRKNLTILVQPRFMYFPQNKMYKNK